jgi:hypothetical protein
VCCEPASSVSIVSVYGLDDRAVPGRGKRIFPIASVCRSALGPTHPASCTVGPGGHFPRTIARPGRDADRSSTSSVEVENE